MNEIAPLSVTLVFPEDTTLKACDMNSPADRNILSIAMNAEIEAFSKHLVSQGMDILVPLERSLIKTFIAWKLAQERKSG